MTRLFFASQIFASQMLVAIPLFLLYELSIGVSAMVERRSKARELRDNSDI